MKKTIRKIFQHLSVLIYGLLIASSLIVLFSTLDTPYSLKFLTVQSGSMEPKIKLGSIVIVKESNTYNLKDVVTFPSPNNNDALITHRIIAKVYDDEGEKILTKGDANEDKDPYHTKDAEVIGMVILTLPYLGFLVNFIKTPLGTVFFIIIPATVFVASQINFIKKETTKYLKYKSQIRQIIL